MPRKFEYDDDSGELELKDVGDDDNDDIDWDWGGEPEVKTKSKRRTDDDEEEDEEEESEDDDEESDEEEDDEEEESGEEDEDEVATPKTAVRGLSKRMDSFEKNLPAIIAAAVKAAVGGKSKDEDDDEEDEEEELPEDMDSATLVKVLSKKIAKTVDQAVDGKLKKYQPAMDEAEVNRVWRKAMQTHGDPFTKNMPAIARLMIITGIEDPNKAWAGFKMLRPEQRKKLRVDAQKTQKKIARRKVDADSEETVTKRPERTPFRKMKGSDSDVFDEAARSSIRTHVKRRRQ